MAGPPSDFATYDALVNNTLFTSPPASNATSALAASESKSAARTHKKSRTPALRKTVAYQKLALGLMFLAIYALYGGKASHERLLDAKWWYSHSKLWRFGFIQLAGFMARSKYYAVWTVAEVSPWSFGLRLLSLFSTRRALVFSLALVSTDMTQSPGKRSGTESPTCSSGTSKPPKVTRYFSTAGTAEPMYVFVPDMLFDKLILLFNNVGMAQRYHLQARYASREKAGFREHPYYLFDFCFLGEYQLRLLERLND